MSNISFKKMGKEHLNIMKKLKEETYLQTHALYLGNDEDQLAWYESLNKDKTRLFLIASKPIDKEPDQFYKGTEIGVFKLDSIDWINRHCNVGWDIFKTHRGRGFGKELVKAGVDFCFKVLNLNRVNCEILVTNLVSLKCAEYAGFEIEGTKRRAVYKSGNWIDSYFLGRLNDSTI